jgi:fumarate reductase subunit C
VNKKISVLRKKLLFLLIPTLIGTVYLGSTVFSSAPKKNLNHIKVRSYAVERRINDLRAALSVLSLLFSIVIISTA